MQFQPNQPLADVIIIPGMAQLSSSCCGVRSQTDGHDILDTPLTYPLDRPLVLHLVMPMSNYLVTPLQKY